MNNHNLFYDNNTCFASCRSRSELMIIVHVLLLKVQVEKKAFILLVMLSEQIYGIIPFFTFKSVHIKLKKIFFSQFTLGVKFIILV